MAVVTKMIRFAKSCFRRLRPRSVEEKRSADTREEKARKVLLSELSQRRTDGKAVSHRRLETLMLAANTQRSETIRLLRKIGARPSSRWGEKWWTLNPKFPSDLSGPPQGPPPPEPDEDHS